MRCPPRMGTPLPPAGECRGGPGARGGGPEARERDGLWEAGAGGEVVGVQIRVKTPEFWTRPREFWSRPREFWSRPREGRAAPGRDGREFARAGPKFGRAHM